MKPLINPAWQHWVEHLRNAGHTLDAEPPTAAEAGERPWYLTLILALSAWFSAMFLLIFIGSAMRPESAVVAGALAVCLLGFSALLMYQARSIFFLQQLAFALSLTAQALLCWPMFEFAGDDQPSLFFAQLFAVQLALALLLPYRAHRIMSFLFAATAWICVVRFWQHDWDVLTRAMSIGATYLRMGIALVPILALLGITLQREPDWIAKGHAPVFRALTQALVIALALLPGLLFMPIEIFGAVQHLSSVVPILGIVCALLAAMAAFQLRSHWLMAFAFVCAFLNLLSLYYALGDSLLQKSLWAAAIGMLALLSSFVLGRGAQLSTGESPERRAPQTSEAV